MNRYPLHLERDLETLYKMYINRISNSILPGLLREYKQDPKIKDIEIDSVDDEIEKILSDLLEGKDLSTKGAQIPVGNVVMSAFMAKRLRATMEQVDKWSARTLKLEATRLGKLRGIEDLGLRIIEKDRILSATLDEVVKENVGLIKDLQQDHVERVTREIKKAVKKGVSPKKLAKRLQKITGASQNQAKFWGRDQVSSAVGRLNRVRQTRSGFPGYIWETVGDNRVRDDHAVRHGEYYEWGKTDKDPGDDYNDRCSPTPALGPEDAFSERKKQSVIAQINRERKFFKQPKVEIPQVVTQ